MTTALYRRYRPETFGEMIGQSQVTDPLMTALRGDRVGHAYLFSGPRGCGKTTSARILARCLNCAEGPTDTPCGTCPSCVELSRAGGGSLDVVEIDAASHNGVDDARDLRERATFAPSRDRFKIFILDEAHMVTPQGFNALLKLVEEPPAHVKFIFATTEPEKVLGTIRSRTHHYPFRLVPPAAMLEYVEKLCGEEGVQVETGVLPLVVRAGGGSPRDTLSLLDQLIAGSDTEGDAVKVRYERAVALLGYTHTALLDEIVDALAGANPAEAFPAVDRVVQTGQDPRRFVDDLLERLRDLIVIAAVGDEAAAVLRGRTEDEVERMRGQADLFGADRLSRTADIVSAALDDMTGATSPRLQLELMVARVLASAAAAASSASTPAAQGTAPSAVAAPAVPPSVAAPSTAKPDPVTPQPPVVERGREATESKRGDDAAVGHHVPPPAPAAAPTSQPTPEPEPAPVGPVTFDRITAAWPAILTRLEKLSRGAWIAVTVAQPLAYDTDTEVLTVGFAAKSDLDTFKGTTPGSGPSDHLRTAIEAELGVRVKYMPAPLPSRAAPAAPADSDAPPPEPPDDEEPPSAEAPARAPKTSDAAAPRVAEWAVAKIPAAEVPPLAVDDEPAEVEASGPTPPTDGAIDVTEPPLPDDEPPYPDDEPPYAPPQPSPPRAQSGVPQDPASAAPSRQPVGGGERYGEAVVRQVLGASFVREEPYEPPTRFS